MTEEPRPRSNSKTTAMATLGGGCFWCLEAVFNEIDGVREVTSGYAGGVEPDPSYRDICDGKTGHAEVVQLRFDPGIISYEELLAIFFSMHDPTTLNRQGADVGPQYRSIILFHDEEQESAAKKLIRRLEVEKIWKSAIVTELSAYSVFYPAEEYHQDYYERNSNQPYCQIVISPKLEKIRKQYADRLKPRD